MNLFETEAGKRIARRLQEEEVIWLTTVDARGRPQPRPVWFQWDGKSVMVWSRPAGAKLRHIRAHPAVALNFNTDAFGGDVGVIIGKAEILPGDPPPDRKQVYLEKYARGIQDLGMTLAQMAADYSVTLLIRPESIRAA